MYIVLRFHCLTFWSQTMHATLRLVPCWMVQVRLGTDRSHPSLHDGDSCWAAGSMAGALQPIDCTAVHVCMWPLWHQAASH